MSTETKDQPTHKLAEIIQTAIAQSKEKKVGSTPSDVSEKKPTPQSENKPNGPVVTEAPKIQNQQEGQEKILKTSQSIVAQELQTGGVFHGSAVEMPEDPHLVDFLADASDRMKHGAKVETILSDLRSKIDSGQFAQDEGLELYKQLGPLNHGELTQQQLKRFEGTGTPAAAAFDHPVVQLDDISGLGRDAEQILTNLRRSQGNAIGDIHTARGVEDQIRRGLHDNPHISDSEAEILRGKADELHRYSQEHQHDERFSTIYLMDSEVEEILKNPAAYFESRLSLMESTVSDTESTLFEANMRRLKMAQELFGSEYFDKQRLEALSVQGLRLENDNSLTMIAELKRAGHSKEKKVLSNYVSARMDVLNAMQMLTHRPDFDKFSMLMKQIGDRAVNLSMANDGGLVGVWTGRFEQNLRHLAYGADGNMQRITPLQLEQARKITVQQFKEERALWQQDYLNFYKRFQNAGDGALPESVQLDDVAIQSIVTRSEFASRLHMRLPVVMVQGATPKEWEWMTGDMNAFATEGNMEETMCQVMRPREWLLRKFGKMPPGSPMQRLWNVGARFLGELDPEVRAEAQKMAASLWKDTTSTDPATKKRALERLSYIIQMNSVEDLDIKAPTAAGWEQNTLDACKRLKLHGVTKLVTLEEGGRRLEEKLLRAYNYFDSTWRDFEYYKHVKNGMEYGDKYFLAYQLQDKGLKRFYNISKTEHERVEANAGFQKVLDKTVNYRPHAFAELLHRGNSETFETWFQHERTLASNPIAYERPDQWFQALDRRFLTINQTMIQNGLPPIDYAQSQQFIDLARLTPDQRTAQIGANDLLARQWSVVEKAFTVQYGDERGIAQMNSAEQYFGEMKRIHGKLTENSSSMLHELNDVHYDHFFLNLLWEDDVPIHYLEDPEQFQNDPEGHKRINMDYFRKQQNDGGVWQLLGLSQLTTENGAGAGSPLGRAWGDFATAKKAFDTFLTSGFTSDEKEFMKMWKEVVTNIDVYQGMGTATEGMGYWAGAWAGAAETKPGLDFIAKFYEDSSVMKEAFGGNALSNPVDKTKEILENIDGLKGRIELHNPLMARKMKDFLRISTIQIGKLNTHISWFSVEDAIHKIPGLEHVHLEKFFEGLDKVMPLGLRQYQSRNLMIYGLIIAAVFGFTQGKKGMEDSESGKK